MVEVQTTYPEFKSLVATKSLSVQYTESAKGYAIFAVDNQILYRTAIIKAAWLAINPVDGLDAGQELGYEACFVANYKGAANQSVEPKTDDGKVIMMPSIFPGICVVGFTSQGDDYAQTKAWGGTELKANLTAAGNATPSFQLASPVYLAGGGAFFTGARYEDYIQFYVDAPATPATEAAGNFDKYALGGGANMFIPAATGQGAWTINTKRAVPVPASAGNGFFDWDDTTNALVPNATQKGKFNIYDFQIHMLDSIPKLLILGDNMHWEFRGTFKAKKFMPGWTMTMKVVKAAGHDETTLTVAGHLMTGREESRAKAGVSL